MIDAYFDFETLSINPCKCAVINCAYVLFDMDRFHTNPYTFEELVDAVVVKKLDVASQVRDFNYEVNGETLKFWKEQPPSVRAQATPKPTDISVETFVKEVANELNNVKITRWWSRGNNFDPVILRRLFLDVGQDIDPFLPYGGLRDSRTYIDTRFNFTLERPEFIPYGPECSQEELSLKFEKHNSKHDIAIDILRIQFCERTIKE